MQAVDLSPISQTFEGGNMARLVRLDRSGNTELAVWNDGDQASYEQVKELPAHVDLVMLRRPIAGG